MIRDTRVAGRIDLTSKRNACSKDNTQSGIALFEPVHGAAPKYAGKNKVNPTATILSGVLMLRYLNERKAADRLENAVKDVIKEGKNVTYDLKPNRNDPTAVGTKEMAEAVCMRL